MTINEAARRVREEKDMDRTLEIGEGVEASEEFKALTGAYFEQGIQAEPEKSLHQRLSRTLFLYAVTCIEIGMIYERERGKP